MKIEEEVINKCKLPTVYRQYNSTLFRLISENTEIQKEVSAFDSFFVKEKTNYFNKSGKLVITDILELVEYKKISFPPDFFNIPPDYKEVPWDESLFNFTDD
jgi:hypothetical protein